MGRWGSFEVVALLILAPCVLLLGCGKSGGGSQGGLVTPSVNVVRIDARETDNNMEITGVVIPERQVEIRSRASGLVTSRRFKGGDSVTIGQLLFTIDPATYRTDEINARAALAQAQAALVQSQGDVDRYRPLLPDNAISGQTYDQAVALTTQNRAVVEARRAGLRQAGLNLSYTEIRSPIAGVIDEPKVDLGSLVTAGDTSLDVVSTLDPILVLFSLPEADYVRYVRASGANVATPERIPLTIILPDGSNYSLAGHIYAVSRTIADTGTLTIRGVFQNPSHLLRPGLNVRVVLPIAAPAPALLAPQRSVGDLLGRKYVYVVGPKDIVEQRFVTLGATVGELQVVQSGLRPGETVIIDGLQLAQPGKPVKATLTAMPSAAAAPGT
jgi:membrane fusion protein (multidrug efflux system)